MGEIVYLLCAATAGSCALLLWRNYRRTRVALLLWCTLFFGTLMLENAALFLDLVIFPDVDASLPRNIIALVGVTLLLYGLIWEVK